MRQWARQRLACVGCQLPWRRRAAGSAHHIVSRRIVLCAGGALALVVALLCRQSLTRSMTLHMLVHIPLIVVAGAWLGRGMSAGGKPLGKGLWAQLNQHGLAGLLLCSLMGAYWMIPKALDEVLLSGHAAAFKFASVLAAGWLLQDSARRANNVIQLFFLGNFCWMTAIVGMLYRESPQRLCNVYLLGDQEMAGIGLIVLAVLLPVAWLWVRRRHIWRFLQ